MEKIICWLFFIYLSIFPFGQLNRLPNIWPNNPEIHLYLTDLIVALIFFIWFFWRLGKKSAYHRPALTKPILIFISIALLSLLVNIPFFKVDQLLIAGLYLLRWLIYVGIYFVISDLKKNFSFLKWPLLGKTMLVIGGFAAFFGLVQYFVWPDLSALKYLNWDPHYYRLVGTWLDPGFTGIILVLVLILWWGIYFPKGKGLALLVYLALALTYSRSSFLALFLATIAIAWLKKKPQVILISLLILVLTIILLPRSPGGEGVRLERTASIKSRLGSWQQAILIGIRRPIFGVGFNTYRYAQKNLGLLNDDWQESYAGAGTDSSFLFVWATTGILGVVSYLWLWLKIITLSLKQEKNSWGKVVFVSAIALITHSWFNNSLFYPWVMGWWMIILGSE